MTCSCQVATGMSIRAIGWLSCCREFTKGNVSKSFLRKLHLQIEDAWQPIITKEHHISTFLQPSIGRGQHSCELCDCTVFSENRNILVPSTHCLYISPAMILHYVMEHNYKPPTQYMKALLVCPKQGSLKFLTMLNRFEEIRDCLS